jgi:hypothetical protein
MVRGEQKQATAIAKAKFGDSSTAQRDETALFRSE